MNIQLEIEQRIQEIEAVLKKYLPKEEGYQKTVLEAMNYSVLAGGKRLRPMLMFETYRLFGGSGRIIEPFAAAIEMIHTYSLVHDDLPAMDNDEYRRGKKTTHAVYGEAMGILAGDALLNFAYETAAEALTMEEGTKTAGKAFVILAKKSGCIRNGRRSDGRCGVGRLRYFKRKTGFYLPAENRSVDRIGYGNRRCFGGRKRRRAKDGGTGGW